jgi:hypothetical protein
MSKKSMRMKRRVRARQKRRRRMAYAVASVVALGVVWLLSDRLAHEREDPGVQAGGRPPAPLALDGSAPSVADSPLAEILPEARPASHHEADRAGEVRFLGTRQEALALAAYSNSISLTSDQWKVQQEALWSLPAPCCSNYSAATCCCKCNLARTIWGLSKHLIAERGFDANQVRDSVEGWIEASNPAGYRGDACSKGGCGRPFNRDGCGGMDRNQLVF